MFVGVLLSFEMQEQCRYGTDKPDLRYGLHMTSVTSTVATCGFKVFSDAAAAGGIVKALRIPEVCVLSSVYMKLTTAEQMTLCCSRNSNACLACDSIVPRSMLLLFPTQTFLLCYGLFFINSIQIIIIALHDLPATPQSLC